MKTASGLEYIEIEAGTDPLDSNSFPFDANENGISDEWEEKYEIDVENGFQDVDLGGQDAGEHVVVDPGLHHRVHFFAELDVVAIQPRRVGHVLS